MMNIIFIFHTKSCYQTYNYYLEGSIIHKESVPSLLNTESKCKEKFFSKFNKNKKNNQ